MKYLITTLVALATLSVGLFAVSVIGTWDRADGVTTDESAIQGQLNATTPKDVDIRNNSLGDTGSCIVTVFYKDPVKVVTATLEHGDNKMFDDPGLVKGDVVVIQDIPNDGGKTSGGGWTVHSP